MIAIGHCTFNIRTSCQIYYRARRGCRIQNSLIISKALRPYLSQYRSSAACVCLAFFSGLPLILCEVSVLLVDRVFLLPHEQLALAFRRRHMLIEGYVRRKRARPVLRRRSLRLALSLDAADDVRREPVSGRTNIQSAIQSEAATLRMTGVRLRARCWCSVLAFSLRHLGSGRRRRTRRCSVRC